MMEYSLLGNGMVSRDQQSVNIRTDTSPHTGDEPGELQTTNKNSDIISISALLYHGLKMLCMCSAGFPGSTSTSRL